MGLPLLAGGRALTLGEGNCPEAGFEPESFDFIRSNHSFEHIANPNEILAGDPSVAESRGHVIHRCAKLPGICARMAGHMVVLWPPVQCSLRCNRLANSGAYGSGQEVVH